MSKWYNNTIGKIKEKFLTLIGYNKDQWYKDEDIHNALERLLPKDQGNTFVAPMSLTFSDTQIEQLIGKGIKQNTEEFKNQKKGIEENAIQTMSEYISESLKNNSVVAVPLNLSDSHWVSLAVVKDKENNLKAFYNDSLGHQMPEEAKKALDLVKLKITNKVGKEETIKISRNNMVDFCFRQQNDYVNCGPYTVENLVKMTNIYSSNKSKETSDFEKELRTGLQEVGDGKPKEFRMKHDKALKSTNSDFEQKSSATAEQANPQVKKIVKGMRTVLVRLQNTFVNTFRSRATKRDGLQK